MTADANLRIPLSPDLENVLYEADAIAHGIGKSMSSLHVLLALFTVPNPAEILLQEKAINEDTLLAKIKQPMGEDSGVLQLLREVYEETAMRYDARSINTLHLLVAMLKTKESAAYVLLDQSLDNLPDFRNRVMSFLTGILPRRLLIPLQEARAIPKRLPRKTKKPRPAKSVASADWVVPRSTLIEDMAAPPPVLREKPKPTKMTTTALPQTTAKENKENQAQTGAEKKPPKREAPVMQPTLPPTAFDLDAERYPWLTSLGRNLTSLAAHGLLDAHIGREQELDQLIDVLGKRRANNPCLVGEPGVGKTAIVEGLAVKMMRGDQDVGPLLGKVIIELDMGRIVAGTSLRGSFSERMQGLKKDVARSKGNVIVFIDEIHTLMGAGQSGEGPQDAANELKAALARGDFPCIGSTTLEEFRKYIESDPAMERRFVKILVDEPDDATAIQILRGAAPLYMKHHQVQIDDDGICATVQLSSRFIFEKRLPAKALDLLDLTLSRARRSGKSKISREEVAQVCADIAKIPLERTLLKDAARFLDMEQALHRSVIGHEESIAKIANVIRRNYAGFTTTRPMGSFLFCGPSGVGKTELAKGLADFIFGSKEALLRFDMSEYSEPHTVARLIGAPPGYVGHGDGGQLTEGIRKRPHAVVLFDEIEKAHSDVLPLLLQILDEGRLTDSKGRVVSFRHAVILLTSNLGAAAFQKQKTVGFQSSSDKAPTEREREQILEGVRKHFAPELWGRIEEKLLFAPLGKAELVQIAALNLKASSLALQTTRNIALVFEDEAPSWIVEQAGLDSGVGARPLRQVIQRYVETPISEAILRREVKEGSKIKLIVKEGKLLARAQRSQDVLQA